MNDIPTRERCGLCLRISPIGFSVPNDIWAAVVHPSRINDIHCIFCFTSAADEKLIPWDRHIEFWPVSLATHLSGVRRIEIPATYTSIAGERKTLPGRNPTNDKSAASD